MTSNEDDEYGIWNSFTAHPLRSIRSSTHRWGKFRATVYYAAPQLVNVEKVTSQKLANGFIEFEWRECRNKRFWMIINEKSRRDIIHGSIKQERRIFYSSGGTEPCQRHHVVEGAAKRNGGCSYFCHRINPTPDFCKAKTSFRIPVRNLACVVVVCVGK